MDGRKRRAILRPRRPFRPLHHLTAIDLEPLHEPHQPTALPRPLMPKPTQLRLRQLVIQHLAHRIRRHDRAIRPARQHERVRFAHRQTQHRGLAARDADAAEEAPQRVRADVVVLLGDDGAADGVAPGEDCWADARAAREDRVGCRGVEVGQAWVAVH